MNSKQKLIEAIEDATVHLGTVPALINLLIDQFGLDRTTSTHEDWMYFRAGKYDLLRVLYLAANIVQDADKAIDDALEEAMKSKDEEG